MSALKQDPFTYPSTDVEPLDPEPLPDPPAQVHTGPASITRFVQVNVELALSTTPFGLPFGTLRTGYTVEVDGSEAGACAAVEYLTGKAVRDLADNLAPRVADSVNVRFTAMAVTQPAVTQIAVTQPTQPTYPQVTYQPAQGGIAAQAAAVVAGAPAPSVDGMAHAPVQVQGGDTEWVHYPTSARMTNQQLVAAATSLAQAQLGLHPTQIKVFDNRADLAAGKPNTFAAAKIVVAQAGSPAAQSALGRNRAIAWVRFSAEGEMSVHPTKDLTGANPAVVAALASPAGGQAPAAQWGGQAASGFNQPPF